MNIIRKALSRLLAFIKNWQEWIAWLPVAVVTLMAVFYIIPAISPRSGIDGFGSLFTLAVQVVKFIVAVSMAYLIKWHFLSDLSKEDENELHGAMLSKERHEHEARWLLMKDRLEWAFLLILAYFWFC